MGAHLLLLHARNGHNLNLFCFELLVIARVRRLYEENIVDCHWWLFLQTWHLIYLLGVWNHRRYWHCR